MVRVGVQAVPPVLDPCALLEELPPLDDAALPLLAPLLEAPALPVAPPLAREEPCEEPRVCVEDPVLAPPLVLELAPGLLALLVPAAVVLPVEPDVAGEVVELPAGAPLELQAANRAAAVQAETVVRSKLIARV